MSLFVRVHLSSTDRWTLAAAFARLWRGSRVIVGPESDVDEGTGFFLRFDLSP